ncbi:MAG: hypothetical protein KME26_06105 [Oscillatoria princeps RMCB-10]|nr:hypothetical protein [Oscillatoria princeps RMCB-10]
MLTGAGKRPVAAARKRGTWQLRIEIIHPLILFVKGRRKNFSRSSGNEKKPWRSTLREAAGASKASWRFTRQKPKSLPAN